MKIILHGVLAEKYGREHVIHTDVPAEAIEGLTRQLPDWPRELVIDVPGYATERLLRSQTDVAELHLVPRMFGGGGKFFKILIGAALIAAAIALPAAGGLYLAGTTIGMSTTAIMSMGIGMVLAGVSQFFMKAPTVNKSNDPPASKYLGINKNTTQIGTPIPLAWGRVKLTGHWLSLQSDSDHLVTTSFPASTT